MTAAKASAGSNAMNRFDTRVRPGTWAARCPLMARSRPGTALRAWASGIARVNAGNATTRSEAGNGGAMAGLSLASSST